MPSTIVMKRRAQRKCGDDVFLSEKGSQRKVHSCRDYKQAAHVNCCSELVKDEYTFGRDSSCDHSFNVSAKKSVHFAAISKVHFRIFRVCQIQLDVTSLITATSHVGEGEI